MVDVRVLFKASASLIGIVANMRIWHRGVKEPDNAYLAYTLVHSLVYGRPHEIFSGGQVF